MHYTFVYVLYIIVPIASIIVMFEKCYSSAAHFWGAVKYSGIAYIVFLYWVIAFVTYCNMGISSVFPYAESRFLPIP